jgi:CheY-like chemotaxis protein
VSQLKKILYIDDQPDIQIIVDYALKTISHYDVKLCSSGEQALAEISVFQPDLILLDVMMPGMDGPQTLQLIRHQTDYKQTPVIFISAKQLPEEIEALKLHEVVGVLAKPFNPLTLGEQIQGIWDGLRSR